MYQQVERGPYFVLMYVSNYWFSDQLTRLTLLPIIIFEQIITCVCSINPMTNPHYFISLETSF